MVHGQQRAYNVCLYILEKVEIWTGVTDPSQTTEYSVTQLVAQQESQQYRWCHVVVPDEVLREVLGTDILKSGDQEFHELSRVALGLREAPL